MPQMPVSWVVSMSSEVRNMAGNAVVNFQRKIPVNLPQKKAVREALRPPTM